MKYLSALIAILFSGCLFLSSTSVVDAKIVCRIDGDIYVMEDDGTKRRRLTQNTAPTRDTYPRWSPDGDRIVFVRDMDQDNQRSSELFLMNADGTNVQRLTDDNDDDGFPSWSPDGKKIVFRSSRSGNWEVHVMDLATRAVTRLTGLEDGEEGSSTVPDWSPDGAQIVYEKFTEFGKDIYVMSADGTNQRPLLRDLGPAKHRLRFFPRWSLDGKKVLFDDCWVHGNELQQELRHRLTIVPIGGKSYQVQGLYKEHGDNLIYGTACWMHADKSLLLDIKLRDKPNPNYDMYRYDLNTQKLTRLTDGEVNEKSPDWIEGPLHVAPRGKKKVTWGAIKE